MSPESAKCKLCPLYSRCVTGNYTAKNVECAECGHKGVQLRRKNTGMVGCDDTLFRFAPCLDPNQKREQVTCRACQALRRARMFA
jgi:hypothetical protein